MADGKYYCGKCEHFHVRGKVYKKHEQYKMKPPSEEQEEDKEDTVNFSERSEERDDDKAYFCKKCHRKHYRGKIYEKHLKHKEEDLTFEESDNFIMKGKMGEELQVKTSKIDDVLRINIYKFNDLRCSLDISVEEDYFKRKDIREFIKEQCF